MSRRRTNALAPSFVLPSPIFISFSFHNHLNVWRENGRKNKKKKRERNNHALRISTRLRKLQSFFFFSFLFFKCLAWVTRWQIITTANNSPSSRLFSVKPQNKMKTVKKIDKNIKMRDVLMSRFSSIINRLSSIQSWGGSVPLWRE
jgi:hypothetical protein